MAVRNETVRLSLQDDFTSGMARAAAATKLLDAALNDLDGSQVGASRSARTTSRDVDALGASTRRTTPDIDRFSGRLRLFADAAAVIGPSLVPIGAVAIPAISGLSAQLGFAAIGAGSMISAFQGVGDAVSAVNEAALDPTAANLEKAQEAMSRIGPDAQGFVLAVRDLMPALRDVRDASAEGLFGGGLTDAVGEFENVLPRIERIFQAVSQAAGEFALESAESFSSERWAPFLDFIEAEAPGALTELGRTMGNFTHGLAEMWMAFDPLNDDFSEWLFRQSESFDAWAASLSASDGFQGFIDYIRENGPKVAESMGALGNSLLQVIEALAPLGGPSLKIIETFSDAIAAIADSDIGTPLLAAAGALALLNRTMAATVKLQGAVAGGLFAGTAANARSAAAGFGLAAGAARAATPTVGQFGTVMYRAGQSTRYASTNTLAARDAVRGFGAQLGRDAGQVARFAGPMAGLALASSDLSDKFELTGTAAGAMIGLIGGPVGVAIGGTIGAVSDLRRELGDVEDMWRMVGDAATSGSLRQMEAVRAQLQAQIDQGPGLIGSMAGGLIGSDVMGDQKRAIAELEDSMAALRSGADTGGAALRTLLVPPLGDAARSADIAAQSVNEFANSFGRLNAMLAGSGSLIAYEQALDDLTASIRENGQAWNAGTDAGRANLQARNQLVNQAIERSTALKEKGDELGAQRILTRAISDLRGFAKESPKAREKIQPFIDKLRDLDETKAKPKVDPDTKGADRKLAKTRGDLKGIDMMRPTPIADLFRAPLDGGVRTSKAKLKDLDGDKATPLADLLLGPLNAGHTSAKGKLRDLDNDKATATADANWSPLASAVDAALGALSRVDGASASATITTTYRTIRETINKIVPFGSAEGNLFPTVQAFSQGDVANAHQPQIAPAGAWRVWAEDETGGEAYIPLRNDHRRPRAEAILSDVASRFGMAVHKYAQGDMVQPVRPVASSPSVNVAAPSLAGVRLEGRITRDSNGDEWFRGIVRDEMARQDAHDFATGR